MKAVFFREHGSNDVLQYGEWPEPQPGAGEVRVAIRAVSLNRLDVLVRNGIPDVPLPQIPGADGAGIVDALGPGVTGFTAGDRVLIQPGLYCGECEFCRGGEQSNCIRYKILGEHLPGTFAEKVVVPARNVFPIPDGLSFSVAAAFPLVYQTAWRMIVSRAAVRAGETVLVHGAGGGVAGAALEIAQLCGARVFATTSGEETAARLREAGVDEVIDYTSQDVGAVIRERTAKRGVDVVVDSVGEKTWMTSLRSAAKGGRIVTCGATSGPNPKEEIRLIFWKQLSILGSTMASDREFRTMLATVAAGKLRPRVDRVFPLSAARDAYARMEANEHHGKIVLVPDGALASWPDGD